MRKKIVYPHSFHNSGRKTGIELHVAKMKRTLKTIKNKREAKLFQKVIDDLIAENKKNKEQGIFTVGDMEVLIKEIGTANFILDKNGNKVPIDREEQKEQLQTFEDLQVKHFKSIGVRYIRKYSEPRKFDIK